jgi:hypothetical protein
LCGKGGNVNAQESITGNTALMVATSVTKDFEKQKLVSE